MTHVQNGLKFPLLAALCLSPAIAANELPKDTTSILAPKKEDNDKGYFTFFFDNDLFGGTDANYTNGGRISYITQGKPIINIPLVQKNLHRLSGDGDSTWWMKKIWGFRDASKVEYSYGFALTQLMFTPETLNTKVPPPGERPYAGWLGVGFSLHARDETALNSIEISIGLVGPNAFAEETQDAVHSLRNLDKFQGWDSQIPQEFTLNASFNRRRRLEELDKWDLPLNLEVDGFYETGYDLGNYLTAAHAGFMIRVGWDLPIEFSDPRLTTTAHTQKLYTDELFNSHSWSFYGLVGGRVGGILHDITLDGPLFRHFDTGVSREPWVAEIYAGFGIRRKGWEFGYVHTFRTKRFKSQKGNQSFGSIAIRTRF